MEATYTLEASIDFQRTAGRYIQQNGSLQFMFCLENRKKIVDSLCLVTSPDMTFMR
jgi:hypothetical protein